jgi:dimethylhistidine N-methyltransferase
MDYIVPKNSVDNLKNFDQSKASLQKDSAVILKEVVAGLSKSQKELPSKYFYDERGSQLFDQICQLQEYYPTRTELAIMKNYIDEISDVLGEDLMFIEYGSGSSEKIKIILDHIKGIRVYVPIDISGDHLIKSAAQIAARYKHIEIIPLCADYSKPFIIPESQKTIRHKIVYFPGSTIGNFHPPEAVTFLSRIVNVVGKDGGLIIGVDLKKDNDVLYKAYNDQQGITAAFNLNQLNHINNVLNTNFDLNAFEHDAFYNSEKGRIEMHLVSKSDQTVQLNGSVIDFKKGETIWTESSYKYD